MTTTTVRRDLRAGLVNAGADFKNQNPTLLLRVYERRPTGFTPDLPALYVGSLNETIIHTAGIRPRTFDAQAVLVGNPTGSPDEIADEVDTLVDYFLDYLTTHPRAAGSNYVLQPTSVRDVELEVDDVVYPSAVVGIQLLASEGRSRNGP